MKRNSRLNNSIFLLLNFLVITGSILAIIISISPKVLSVKATDYNYGRIIDDEIFYNKNAMSVQDIQNLLNKQIGRCDTWGAEKNNFIPSITNAEYAKRQGWSGPPYVCINNYHENPQTKETSFEKGGGAFDGGISAAQIIYNAAQKYGINPQVLITLLRKESAGPLTNDRWPLKNQYKYSMGYACPDSGPGFSANCDNSKAGFYNQMELAAWQLKYYKDHPNDYSYKIGRNNIQYSPNPACGIREVYIENIATLSLYIYTPYVPNEGALRNYPGTSHCGAYGNRNFFMFFNEWFGSTTVEKYTPGNPISSNTSINSDNYFSLKTNANKYFDVSNSSTVNGTKVITFSNHGGDNQKFKFELTRDGFYIIRSKLNNNKVIDFNQTKAGESVKIHLWEYEENKCSQKWALIKKSNGKFNIVSACDSNMAIDVYNNYIDRNLIELQIFKKHDGSSQEWVLDKERQNIELSEDKLFYISSVKGKNINIEESKKINGTRISLFDQTNNPNQLFKLIKNSDNTYSILSSLDQSMAIDLHDGKSINENKIQLWKHHNGCSQKWILNKKDNGKFNIFSACDASSVIDIPNNLHNNGNRLQVFALHKGENQEWSINEFNKPIDEFSGNTFSLKTNANKYFDVSNSSTVNGTKVITFSNHGGDNQKFKFELTRDGFYIIRSKLNNNKVIDFNQTKAGESVKIHLWEYEENKCSQKWALIKKSNGKFNIVSACDSNMAIDVYNNYIDRNLIELQIFKKHDGSSQEWVLDKIK